MILFALMLGLPGQAPSTPEGSYAELNRDALSHASSLSIDTILSGLRATETGGRDVRGDAGRAIGPYQIHRAYFDDSGVQGTYSDCRDPEFARRVVLAYWKRWCPDALENCDAQILARVHNGGPRGASKAGTLAYWRKFEQQLILASARSWRVRD